MRSKWHFSFSQVVPRSSQEFEHFRTRVKNFRHVQHFTRVWIHFTRVYNIPSFKRVWTCWNFLEPLRTSWTHEECHFERTKPSESVPIISTQFRIDPSRSNLSRVPRRILHGSSEKSKLLRISWDCVAMIGTAPDCFVRSM